MLAERLDGAVSLVPDDDERRARMFGLSHEILGEGGLGWSVRLLLTHRSLATDGREGWPKPVAEYLAPALRLRARARISGARPRHRGAAPPRPNARGEPRCVTTATFSAPRPTAVDVHAAVALAVIDPLPEAQCPMLAPVRHAFETLDQEVKEAVSPALREHRALMFERHLVLPVRY